MRWYKHLCDLSRDPLFAAYLAKAGLEGWGFLHRIYEIVGDVYKPGGRPELSYPIRTWCTMLGIHRNRFNRLLKSAHTCGVIDANLMRTGGVCSRFEEASAQDTLTLSCPKLLQLKDEYSRKSGHTPDKVAQDEDEELEGEPEGDQTNDQRNSHVITRRKDSPEIVSVNAQEVRRLAAWMMDATGDQSFGRNGTLRTIENIIQAGKYEDLESEIDHVAKDQDPGLAAARGFAMVEEPARYMQAALNRLRSTQ